VMYPATHTVSNQVPDLVDYNLYETDTVLRQVVNLNGGQGYAQALSDYGEHLGRAGMFQMARRVNQQKPVLQAFDRQGRRVDQVLFDAGWHGLLGMQMAQGMHGLA